MPRKPVVKKKATGRWDFSDATARAICERAAARCANPNCRKIARIITGAGDGVVGFGEAAHIIAAAEGGPRERSGTRATVTSEQNGLWLCCNCHRTVDRDSSFYSAERLRGWKAISEKEFDYAPITLAISLPGHYKPDGNHQTPGLTSSTAKLGLHVLAGGSRGLKGVCLKLSIELLTAFGGGELRSHKYYQDISPGVAAEGMDWHSFMLEDGSSQNIYFVNQRVGWLNHNPGQRDGVILLRAKAYGRLGGDELEPFTSPWYIGVIKGGRIEYDDNKDYAHLLRWADLIQRLSNSGSNPHKEFASAIIRLQRYHTGWPMLALESFNNRLIATPPALLHEEPDTHQTIVAPLNLGNEVIEGIYNENGYLIKVSFAENPSKSPALDRTNVHEFWNGGGGAGIHHAEPEEWKRRWVLGEDYREKLLTDGAIRPGD